MAKRRTRNAALLSAKLASVRGLFAGPAEIGARTGLIGPPANDQRASSAEDSSRALPDYCADHPGATSSSAHQCSKNASQHENAEEQQNQRDGSSNTQPRGIKGFLKALSAELKREADNDERS